MFYSRITNSACACLINNSNNINDYVVTSNFHDVVIQELIHLKSLSRHGISLKGILTKLDPRLS